MLKVYEDKIKLKTVQKKNINTERQKTRSLKE